MEPQLHIHPDASSNSQAAAQFLADTAQQAIQKNGRFVVSLAGGSTPKKMYELLAESPFADTIDWSKCYIIWGDERCVPETSPDSNSRMAKEAWLNKVDIPAEQILPMDGTLPPAEGAQQYEATLKALLGENGQLDLCLLGMGDDGHTASLFPHTKVLDVTDQWVSEVYVEKLDSWRLTLTAPFIRNSASIAFLVSGAKKADALQQVLKGDYQPATYPSQLIIREQANTHLFLDEAAATKVK